MNKIRLKYLTMDVDGTLTDGKLYMGPDGEVMKVFSAKDGAGIKWCSLEKGILPIIITGRESRINNRRAEELGITMVFQGVKDKLEEMLKITTDLSCVAYIGDDMSDLPVMNEVKKAGGVVGCPSDAVEAVKRIADYISPLKGGEGAVRDFIEWITA